MLPPTIVRAKCCFALQGCSFCWLLFSFLGSSRHCKPFDEGVVAGRAEGPEEGNGPDGWTSTGLPSFLLASAAPHTPSLLQGQRPPTGYNDFRSPGTHSLDGGDGRRQTEEGDDSSLVEENVAAASYSDDWGHTVEGDESSLAGTGLTWETAHRYSQEEGDGSSLSPSAPPPEGRSPSRWSRKLKRESRKRILRTLMSVLSGATLLGALLVYRKLREPGENPSGRGSFFSRWLVRSGMSQKRRVGAILLAGVILIVAAVLALDFAGTEGRGVRADGEITSSTSRGATAPSDSPVSSISRLVEIGKSVGEVLSKAPMSAVAVAFAVMTLSFLTMRLSRVRGQTEVVGEGDSGQTAGEAESADEGKRQEDYEDAGETETIAEREGTKSGADADVVVEEEKEEEAKAEGPDEGAVAEERKEQPQTEAEEAKTIAEEAERKADERDESESPDVPSKAQGEEESGTDTAGEQEAQKAPEGFTPHEVPPLFDYRPVFRAMTDDIAAQARSGKYQKKDKFQLSDYPSAETEARRQIGKLRAAIANVSPELYEALERQLGILGEPWGATDELRERCAHLTSLSLRVQVAVVEKNLSTMEEGLLQRRFHDQFMEFSRHVGGEEAILRHIRAALADGGSASQQAQGRSGEGGMSVVLEKLASALEKKTEILLDAVDFTGGVRSDYSGEFRRTLRVVNNAISRAKHQLSELKPAAL